jgi:hypothetical protein
LRESEGGEEQQSCEDSVHGLPVIGEVEWLARFIAPEQNRDVTRACLKSRVFSVAV